MGGQGSDMFEYFKILILQGLVAARKHSDKIITLVDVMRAGNYIWLFLLELDLIKMIWNYPLFMSLIVIFSFDNLLYLILGSQLPCFTSSSATVQSMKQRFHLNMTEDQLHSLVDSMVINCTFYYDLMIDLWLIYFC